MFKYKGVVFVIAGLLSVNYVLAYIDPGTGGMIVSSIWPVIVSIFVAIGAFFLKFFTPIKNGFKKLWQRKKE